jgi:hypothetical protein
LICRVYQNKCRKFNGKGGVMNDNENGGQEHAVCRLNTGLSVCCALMLGVLLSWNNAYANDEEFATVRIGESANVTLDVDGQSPGVENLEASAIVESTDTESKPIHTDADLLDVAQLDLAGSQDMRSLDVIDTGSSVEFPNAVGELGGGIDDQKANDMIEQGDQSLVTGISAKLPVTNTADAHSQVGDAGNQFKDVSSDAASEGAKGVPVCLMLSYWRY